MVVVTHCTNRGGTGPEIGRLQHFAKEVRIDLIHPPGHPESFETAMLELGISLVESGNPGFHRWEHLFEREGT